MEIEQLKLILETVSGIGGDALAAAITWIVIDGVLPFIGWMVFLFLSYRLAFVMARTMREAEKVEGELKDLGRKMGVSVVFYNSDTRRRIIERLHEKVDQQ